ncbi:MAG: hypothetical protein ACFNM4_07980 [Prevotella nigrescens]
MVADIFVCSKALFNTSACVSINACASFDVMLFTRRCAHFAAYTARRSQKLAGSLFFGYYCNARQNLAT